MNPEVAAGPRVTAVSAAPRRTGYHRAQVAIFDRRRSVPDWLIPAICGVVIVAVLVKAFWNPPKRDPLKPEPPALPPNVG